MPRFRLMCRAVLEPAVIEKLELQKIQLDVGGSPGGQADEDRRYQFDLEADDEASALEKAHAILSAAGADVSDLRVV